jgi:hypothetical protein
MENFIALNQSVFLYEPTSLISFDDAPDLIVLVGWMDAKPRNLSKYSAGYMRLYPSAQIIVITTSTLDAAFRTNRANLDRIAPVLELLYRVPSNRKTLIHSFSDGGGWTSCLIAQEYKEKLGRQLPMTALLLDSAPGRATFAATTKGFAIALPKNIVIKGVGTLAIVVFWCLYMLGYWLLGKADLRERTRGDLNDKSLFSLNAPRMYIYSDVDEIVASKLVEEHAMEAEAVGYKVDREKFLGSIHNAHLLKDQNRYWDTVQRLWKVVG